MKNKFSQNDLIFYFQQYDFPKKLVLKDVLIHKDLLFNDEGEEPELMQQKKKIKYSTCFIQEEEIEAKGKSSFKKNSQISKGGKQPAKPKENAWRKNEPEDNSGGFFDNFKGKTDEKEVAQFKRNLEVTQKVENSISIVSKIFTDHLSKTTSITHTLNFNEKNEDTGPQTLSADNFFENAEKIMRTASTTSTDNSSFKEQKQSKLSQIMNNINPNSEIVNIDLVFKVNDFLQYPIEQPLWYVFHPGANSAFGPLPSPSLKEMYDGKMLNGQTEIRFIDIYNYKQKKPFSYFLLKEIDNPNFLEEIEISPLLKVAVGIKSKQIVEQKEEKSTNNPNTKEITPTIKVEVPKNNNSTTLNKQNKVNTQNYSNDSIYSIQTKPNINTPTIEEKIIMVDEKNDKLTEESNKGFKKTKKLPKGKPVVADLKLGFKVEDDHQEPKLSSTQTQTQQSHSHKQQANSYNRNTREFNNNNNNHPNNNNFQNQNFQTEVYYDDGYNEGYYYDSYNDYNNNYYQNNNYSGSYYNNRSNYWKK